MIDSSYGQCITAAIAALKFFASQPGTERVPGRPNRFDGDNLLGIAEALTFELSRTPQQRVIIPLRSEVAWETEDIAKMLKSSRAQIIHARRRSAKTWNLLFHIFDNCGSRAIIVCPNDKHKEHVLSAARQVYDLKYIRRVGDAAHPLPMVMTANAFYTYICGHEALPTFVDEWNLFTLDDQVDIAKSGWLVKAVTS